MKVRGFHTLFLLASILALIPGCLKTRSQVKGAEEQAEEQPADNLPKQNTRYEIEELKNEVVRLNGKVEELEHNYKNSDGDSDVNQRLQEIEKNQMLILADVKKLKDQQEEIEQKSFNPKQTLRAGQKLLKQKKYEDALEQFRQVNSKNSRGHDLAEAYFGIGEAEYGLKNYKKAILAYSKVQEIAPKSNLAPTSVYKIGWCFKNLNMNKEAKSFFSEVVEKYPKSPEAKKAKSKL
ncbi:MAG: tetratricopeptide repeat protein [Bacteriovoracia bacterium]